MVFTWDFDMVMGQQEAQATLTLTTDNTEVGMEVEAHTSMQVHGSVCVYSFSLMLFSYLFYVFFWGGTLGIAVHLLSSRMVEAAALEHLLTQWLLSLPLHLCVTLASFSSTATAPMCLVLT